MANNWFSLFKNRKQVELNGVSQVDSDEIGCILVDSGGFLWNWVYFG